VNLKILFVLVIIGFIAIKIIKEYFLKIVGFGVNFILRRIKI